MTIPSPPVDSSGGYFIATYTNGTDTHRTRQHVRAFDGSANYVAPGAGTPTSVLTDFTGFAGKFMALFNSAWSMTLTSIFTNNGDGTFTELFGWTQPAAVAGTFASATPNDQTRASELIFNFRDGHGGRGRCILIGSGGNPALAVPQIVGGASGGNVSQQLIDYLTNPVKTNIVSHAGHQYQSPARVTEVINKRLRRHYGYA